MKKEKSQAQGKGAKKQIKESIQNRLEKFLTTIAGELGDKTHIDIEKESKKLAKKLVKGLALKEASKPVKAAPVKEAIANAAPDAAAKPTKVSKIKKTLAKAAVTKPAPAKVEPAPKNTVKPAVPKAAKNGAAKPARK